MKWRWNILACVLYICEVLSVGAACYCGEGYQSFIPSYATFDAPSSFNGSDYSPSSFGNSCEEQDSLYHCTDNTENPLFDCSTSNYYRWNSGVSLSMNFTSHFNSLNVLMTFLVTNASVPTSLQYFPFGLSLSVQDNLPTSLPKEPYHYNFTLSPGILFNGVVIKIILNNTWQWIAIGKIILCAATTEGNDDNDNDDGLVSITVISMLAIFGTALIIIITLEITILLLHQKRKISDHKLQRHTQSNASQLKHHHSNTSRGMLSQGVKHDTKVEMYMSSKVDYDGASVPRKADFDDVSITANPSYNFNSTKQKSEQQCDYDYYMFPDQDNKFQSVVSITSDGAYDDTIIDSVGNESYNFNSTKKKSEQQCDYDYYVFPNRDNKFQSAVSITSDGAYDDTINNSVGNESDHI